MSATTNFICIWYLQWFQSGRHIYTMRPLIAWDFLCLQTSWDAAMQLSTLMPSESFFDTLSQVSLPTWRRNSECMTDTTLALDFNEFTVYIEFFKIEFYVLTVFMSSNWRNTQSEYFTAPNIQSSTQGRLAKWKFNSVPTPVSDRWNLHQAVIMDQWQATRWLSLLGGLPAQWLGPDVVWKWLVCFCFPRMVVYNR